MAGFRARFANSLDDVVAILNRNLRDLEAFSLSRTITSIRGGSGDSSERAASALPIASPAVTEATEHNLLKGLNEGDLQHLTEALQAYVAALPGREGKAQGPVISDINNLILLEQIPVGLLGGLTPKGAWDPATNTPTLANPAPATTRGWFYIASVGSESQLGNEWKSGDWAISDGSVWQKIDNTDKVASVFGRTGAVTAQSGDYNLDQVSDGATYKRVTATEKAQYAAAYTHSQSAHAPANADNTQSALSAAAAKITPVDADVIPILDSAASWAAKKLSWANIKAAIKSYLDTLYSAVGHAHAASAITSTATGDVSATNVQAAIAELASEKLASSTAASAYQTKLAFDSAPTSGSTNPVTSGGVYTALAATQEWVNTKLAGKSDAVSTGLKFYGGIGGLRWVGIAEVDTRYQWNGGGVHVRVADRWGVYDVYIRAEGGQSAALVDRFTVLYSTVTSSTFKAKIVGFKVYLFKYDGGGYTETSILGMETKGNISAALYDYDSETDPGGFAPFTACSYEALGHVKNVTSDIQVQLNGKAATTHASSSTTYGVGDTANYGHVKVDAAPTDGSSNAVSSNGVFDALALKADKSQLSEYMPLQGTFFSDLPIPEGLPIGMAICVLGSNEGWNWGYSRSVTTSGNDRIVKMNNPGLYTSDSVSAYQGKWFKKVRTNLWIAESI